MQIKNILLAVEIVLLSLFLVPFPIFNIGNAAGIAVCTALILITAKHSSFFAFAKKLWSCVGGKIAIVTVCTAIAAGMAYAAVLSANMYKAMKNEPEEPDILVVLGCKVRGEKPTRMLRRRLDAAYDYMQENPDVMCIVSGGQGSDESVAEAQAMKNYLVEKGISADRIIMEDKSTSTDENIENSLAILDSLGLERRITIVTDGFHQYRAGLIAKKHGIEQVHAVSADTEPRYLFTYWVREWFGIAQFQLLNGNNS